MVITFGVVAVRLPQVQIIDWFWNKTIKVRMTSGHHAGKWKLYSREELELEAQASNERKAGRPMPWPKAARRASTAHPAAARPLAEGDNVLITKEGSQKGNKATVIDAEWESGQVCSRTARTQTRDRA